jgi:hypothetical protein
VIVNAVQQVGCKHFNKSLVNHEAAEIVIEEQTIGIANYLVGHFCTQDSVCMHQTLTELMCLLLYQCFCYHASWIVRKLTFKCIRIPINDVFKHHITFTGFAFLEL